VDKFFRDSFRVCLKLLVLYLIQIVVFIAVPTGEFAQPKSSGSEVFLALAWFFAPIGWTVWSEIRRSGKIEGKKQLVDPRKVSTKTGSSINSLDLRETQHRESTDTKTSTQPREEETALDEPPTSALLDRPNSSEAALLRLAGSLNSASNPRNPEKQIEGIGREKPVQVVQTPKPPSSFQNSSVGWLAKGEYVEIAGRKIDGMIYVGPAPPLDRDGYGQKCRAYIDPSLVVAGFGRDPTGSQLPYRASYHDINPVCRATYLDWLAGGRRDPNVHSGYVAMFFYGLERRFLVENSSEGEKYEILSEAERLKSLIQTNHSSNQYLSELLEFVELAKVKLNCDVAIEDGSVRSSMIKNRGWELPLTLRVGLGRQLAKGQSVSAEWLYTWFMCHQDSRLRTPAERCGAEFEALFLAKSKQRFPSGHNISPPKKKLTYYYRSASGEIDGEVELRDGRGPILDVSGLHAPISIAQKIADEAMDELDKFSRYLGRSPNNGRGSVEAQALLPTILWDVFPSSKMTALSRWAGDRVADGGLVPVAEVLAEIQGAAPDPNWKRQLADVADALSRLGFGLAPDLRHSLRSPTRAEPVIIFDLGQKVDQVQKASPQYLAALVEITLAAFIAHADRKVVEAERRALYAKVTETAGIPDIERRTLKAHVDWYLEVPPDLSIMGSKLKDADADQQALFRAIMVASAHADGIIQSEEVARIERVYKALGIDQALAYSDLHAGQQGAEPVRVRAAEAYAPGEQIPFIPKPPITHLNTKRIAEIQADTARVSMVLGKIFSNDDGIIDVAPLTAASSLEGLDQKHADFVGQIIQQLHWTEIDFDKLATSSGLMPTGALEVINEWSFQNLGDCLLDAFNGYDVAPEIAAILRAKLTKET
jgi:hypothetical protein